MGNSFELGNRIMKNVDLKSAEVVGRNYLKDKSNVYYEDKLIKNADPGSIKIFTSKCDFFAIDKNMLYYQQHTFRDIDVASCQLACDNCLSIIKDKNHIYSTFSIDFYTDKVLIIPPVKGLDPDKYQALSNVYGRDENLVYYKCEPIQGADPKTFIILKDYAKDVNSVYYNGVRVKNLGAATFQHVDGGRYLKDKNAVYYGLSGDEDSNGTVKNLTAKVVVGADPETFIMIKGEKKDYARDKSTFYWGGEAQ